jgi:hypothetical protein
VVGPDPNAVSTAKVVIPNTAPSEDGKLSVSLPDDRIEAILLEAQIAAQAEAAETGAPVKPVSLLITPDDTQVKGLEVTLSPAVTAKLEESGAEALEIQAPGHFQFILDAKAIAELNTRMGPETASVTLVAEPVETNDLELEDEARQALEKALGVRSSRPMMDFSISTKDSESGEVRPVADLGGGTLTRAITYRRRYYEKPEYIQIVRVSDDGGVTPLENARYHEDAGLIWWEGNTCSLYGVSYGKPGGESPADGAQLFPEKVQLIGADGGAVQYDYATVVSGGVNRQTFVDDLLTIKPVGLLILADGLWYDVNQITLQEAVEDDRVDDPSPDYRAVLENRTETTGAAAEIIDWLNGIIWSLEEDDAGRVDLSPVKRIYALYQGLTLDEQAQIGYDQAVQKMLELIRE